MWSIFSKEKNDLPVFSDRIGFPFSVCEENQGLVVKTGKSGGPLCFSFAGLLLMRRWSLCSLTHGSNRSLLHLPGDEFQHSNPPAVISVFSNSTWVLWICHSGPISVLWRFLIKKGGENLLSNELLYHNQVTERKLSFRSLTIQGYV